MVFSSIYFMFVFLPISLILYTLCPKKIKNVLLVLISLVFYAWGSPLYLLLLLLSMVFNYCTGMEIGKLQSADRPQAAKTALVIGVVVNLVLLGFYKYAGFLVENLNRIPLFHISAPALALPIGISFFTFQTLSYLFDVYRGKAPVQESPLAFSLYVSFFPKMVSGPIVQYHDMAPQLTDHPVTAEKVVKAVPMILIGLGKKVILADTLATTFGAISAMSFAGMSTVTAWLGAICYTLELYFDFSGYSDMAIGIAMLFGFEFSKNFDYSYTADSITDFWRRWHISLGAWFRDYVYIPLGGSRVTTGKHIRNLLVVWMLTGLWHGSNWTFVVWGLYHGLWQILEKYPLKNVLPKIPHFARRIITFILALIGWVFFFSPTIGSAFGYLGQMLGAGDGGFMDATAKYYLASDWKLLVICFIACTPLAYNIYRRFMFGKGKGRIALSVALFVVLFLLCTAFMMSSTYQSFLYFQF